MQTVDGWRVVGGAQGGKLVVWRPDEAGFVSRFAMYAALVLGRPLTDGPLRAA